MKQQRTRRTRSIGWLSPWACRRADLWLAAHEAGTLQRAEQIELQEHLQHCESCQQRAQRLGEAVSLLREPASPSRRQREALWQAVERRITAGQATRPTSQRRPWVRLVVAAAATTAVAALLWLAVDRGRTPARPHRAGPALATGKAGADAGTATAPAPASRGASSTAAGPARWTVVATRQAVRRHGAPLQPGAPLPPDEPLVVRSAGQAVLHAGGHLLVLAARTRASVGRDRFTGAPAVHLEQGSAVVGPTAGHEPRAASLTIRVDRLLIRPVGTLFSVTRQAGAAPRIAVADGRVEIDELLDTLGIHDMHRTAGQADPAGRSRKSRRSVSLAAGQALTWGAAIEPLSNAGARRLRSMLELARSGLDDRRPAATRPRRGRPAHRVSSGHGDQLSLERAEQLLAAGQTAEARGVARAILARGGTSEAQHPELRTVVAESYLRERRPRQARDAYLALWRAHPGHPLGADALFMVGSIDLDHLGRPAAALTRFERYLASYRHGPQRQGAHYLLYRCLRQLGRSARADAAAAAYRREFPQGQYVEALQ